MSLLCALAKEGQISQAQGWTIDGTWTLYMRDLGRQFLNLQTGDVLCRKTMLLLFVFHRQKQEGAASSVPSFLFLPAHFNSFSPRVPNSLLASRWQSTACQVAALAAPLAGTASWHPWHPWMRCAALRRPQPPPRHTCTFIRQPFLHCNDGDMHLRQKERCPRCVKAVNAI